MISNGAKKNSNNSQKVTLFFIQVSSLNWDFKKLRRLFRIVSGNSIQKQPYLDFTIVTECDHHITSLGTFSFTSALMGYGTLAYDISSVNYTKYYFANGLICGDPQIYIPIY